MAKRKKKTSPKEFADAFDRFLQELKDSTAVYGYKDLMDALEEVNGFNRGLKKGWDAAGLQTTLIDENVNDAWTDYSGRLRFPNKIYSDDQLFNQLGRMRGVNDTLVNAWQSQNRGKETIDKNVDREWVNVLNSERVKQKIQRIYSDNTLDNVYSETRGIMQKRFGADRSSLNRSGDHIRQMISQIFEDTIKFNRAAVEGIRDKTRLMRNFWGKKETAPVILQMLEKREVQRSVIDKRLRARNKGTERELTPLSQSGLIERGSKRGRWKISERGQKILDEYRRII